MYNIIFPNILFTGFYSCNTEIMPGINNWTPEIQVRLFGRKKERKNNQKTNKKKTHLFSKLGWNMK